MKLIIFEDPISASTSEAALRAQIDSVLDGFAISCKVEQRDTGRVLVTVFPDPEMQNAANAAGKHPRELFASEINEALTVSSKEIESNGLGELSRKYESNGDPGAVGEDRTGGPSYGLYQLASARGSVASFLKFLKEAKPEFEKKLQEAGGDTAARDRAPTFVTTWKKLAEDSEFAALQHGFIKRTYFDVFVDHVMNQLGIDVLARHKAVHDVAWSTAVQHGQKNNIFNLALRPILPSPPSEMDDRTLINAVYDERSKVNQHFASSREGDKESVRIRFVNERKDALAMLTTV